MLSALPAAVVVDDSSSYLVVDGKVKDKKGFDICSAVNLATESMSMIFNITIKNSPDSISYKEVYRQDLEKIDEIDKALHRRSSELDRFTISIQVTYDEKETKVELDSIKKRYALPKFIIQDEQTVYAIEPEQEEGFQSLETISYWIKASELTKKMGKC